MIFERHFLCDDQRRRARRDVRLLRAGRNRQSIHQQTPALLEKVSDAGANGSYALKNKIISRQPLRNSFLIIMYLLQFSRPASLTGTAAGAVRRFHRAGLPRHTQRLRSGLPDPSFLRHHHLHRLLLAALRRLLPRRLLPQEAKGTMKSLQQMLLSVVL